MNENLVIFFLDFLFADWEYNVGLGQWDTSLTKEEVRARLAAFASVNKNISTICAFNFVHYSNVSTIAQVIVSYVSLEVVGLSRTRLDLPNSPCHAKYLQKHGLYLFNSFIGLDYSTFG